MQIMNTCRGSLHPLYLTPPTIELHAIGLLLSHYILATPQHNDLAEYSSSYPHSPTDAIHEH